jgi:hypothetical protein
MLVLDLVGLMLGKGRGFVEYLVDDTRGNASRKGRAGIICMTSLLPVRLPSGFVSALGLMVSPLMSCSGYLAWLPYVETS